LIRAAHLWALPVFAGRQASSARGKGRQQARSQGFSAETALRLGFLAYAPSLFDA